MSALLWEEVHVLSHDAVDAIVGKARVRGLPSGITDTRISFGVYVLKSSVVIDRLCNCRPVGRMNSIQCIAVPLVSHTFNLSGEKILGPVALEEENAICVRNGT